MFLLMGYTFKTVCTAWFLFPASSPWNIMPFCMQACADTGRGYTSVQEQVKGVSCGWCRGDRSPQVLLDWGDGALLQACRCFLVVVGTGEPP